MKSKLTLSCLAAMAACGAALAENRITVDVNKVVAPAAEDLWGIFFEDIDLSLDGGVYAEMVRNRSFEDGDRLGYWDAVGAARLESCKDGALSEKNAHYCRLTAKAAGAGIANAGYFGYGLKKDLDYKLSIALRSADVKGVEVALEGYGKPVIAKADIDGLTGEWKTYTVTLKANACDPAARFVIKAKTAGTVDIDCVSMFPGDAVAGLFRKDLMDRLAALKPSFVRFPGGCWVEGERMDKAYRWKKTIGDKWERATVWNIWKYWATNGVGFHEFLLISEALNAKPLYCINVGISHKEIVPMEKMDEFVQDALDCIEYANGGVDTYWGKKRAEAGHPAPFGLKYLEIGNENGGPEYEKRYALMAKAVRAKYPDVKLIFDRWSSTKKITDGPADLRDDHYYDTPEWFNFHNRRYERPEWCDGCDGKDFKAFVGEYAVTRGVGPYGSIKAAVGEAAFMTGLEKNPQSVQLAAYAPLFAHAKHMTWKPDLIYQTTDGNFVNPSWHVQRLFSEYRGKDVLGLTVEPEKIGNQDVISASAVRSAKGETIVKITNFSDKPAEVKHNLKGTAKLVTLTGDGPDASNTPYDREAIQTVEKEDALTPARSLVLPPWSFTVVIVK